MGSNYKYILGAVVIVVIAAIAYMVFFHDQDAAMKKFAAGGRTRATLQDQALAEATAPSKALFCPAPEGLSKDGVKWTAGDKKWETYTPSAATKVLNFTGAQWVGVKVGKIICLYQTDEAVSFPMALEQTRSQSILEPRSISWSALVGNRRFCKSASVADCPYFLEPQKNISNVYKEIEYAPDKDALA